MADKNNLQTTNESSTETDPQSPQRSQNGEKRSLLANLFPFLRVRNNSSLRDDLTDSITGDDYNGNAEFSPEERIMLNNILRLGESHVEDLMIPRPDIQAIEINCKLSDVLEHFEKSGHSRMPVYEETMDEPRGMIHIRDVLNCITSSARSDDASATLDLTRIDLDKPIGELDLIRPVLFVPGSMLASQLLTRMQATRTQMALVIDEYGGTDGLASMEDIVELVIGDIEDEHDDEDVAIIHEADGKWLVDASADLDEVVETIGSDFNVGEHGEDVDTIGGLIVAVLDRIPTRGEVVDAVPNYRFRILEADKRRIKRIRIERMDLSEQKSVQKPVETE